jgi:ubiquinone/menaquinone biosynthesis C-methylase UbiE
MPQKVVNYDGYDYDYSTYWKDRQYENNAEHLVINKFLKNEKGDWFIDIGGSYGRLADTYVKRYKNCVILDYSLKTLQKNKELITKQFPNTFLIAANAYKTPFKKDVFNGGLMVRVLHHIERQKDYFEELVRIMQEDGIYIQEFANKRHIKARIRAFLKGDKSIRNEEPYQQPTINLEGAKGDGVSFLNYHSNHIKRLLEESGFEVEDKQGCSYLRVPLIKRLLGTKIVTFLEKILQKLFKNTDIPPSIFFKTRVIISTTNPTYTQLNEILVCPDCKADLNIESNRAICTKCNKEFIKKEGVWDFRTE